MIGIWGKWSSYGQAYDERCMGAVSEAARRHGWLRKFVNKYRHWESRIYLGGDPSIPESWGNICDHGSYKVAGPYEVYP